MKIKTLLSALLFTALLLSPVALMEEVSEPQVVVLEVAAPAVDEEEKAESEEDTEQPITQIVASEEDDSQIDEEVSVETDQEIASEPVDEVVMEAADVDLSDTMEEIVSVENEETMDDNDEVPLVEDSVTLSGEVDCASFEAMYAVANPYRYQHYTYYDKYGNPEEIANCTHVAWQQAYDRLGIVLSTSSWGNATYWYSKAEGVYPEGSEPRVNSIACYSGNPGHVAYVIGVNGNNITVVENGHWNGTYENSLATRSRSGVVGSYYGENKLEGYIYLDVDPTSPTVSVLSYGLHANVTWNDVGASSYYIYLYNKDTGNIPYGENIGRNLSSLFELAEGNYDVYVTAVYPNSVMKSGSASFKIEEYRANVDKGQDGVYSLNENVTISLNSTVFDTCVLRIYRTPTGGKTELYWEGMINARTYTTSFSQAGYYACSFEVTKNNGNFFSQSVGWIVSDNSSTIHTHTPKTVNGYAATCGKMGISDGVKCDVCGVWITNQTTIPATGNHSWGAWTTIQDPTCTAEGRKVHTCSVCQQIETQSIAATGHTAQIIKGRAATSSSTGLTDGVQCSVCKIWLIPQESIAVKTDSSTPLSGGSSSSPDPVVAPALITVSTPAEPITIAKTPAAVKTKAGKKGKVTVSWKKIEKTKKTKALLNQINGIEVQYSTDPTFATNTFSKVVGKKKTKVTLKGIQKTVYYIRVRYTDGAGGISNWSATKKVKTKK